MGWKVAMALIVATGLIVTACGGSPAVTPTQPNTKSPLVSPSIAATPEPTVITTPMLTPSASPTLPTSPTLTDVLDDGTTTTYIIKVLPVATPLDETTATARAREIGGLVGLTEMFDIYQDPTDWTWRAHFVQEWDGIPVVSGSVELDIRPDGTVDRFYRETGPRAARPSKLITKAQAERAVPRMKVDDAQLQWDRAGTEEYHVVWFLRHTGIGGGPDWGGAAWIDAGTGKILQMASVS